MDAESDNLYLRLKRYLKRFLKRPEDVEDITQQSFLKVLEAGSKGKIRYPKAYLFRTARNLALNANALKSNHVVDYVEGLLSSDVITETARLEDELIVQHRFELFCRAAAKLPEQCRKVLILCKVYGYSQKEVAAKLGISTSTVEKHVAKGMLRCSEYLAARGYFETKSKDLSARQ